MTRNTTAEIKVSVTFRHTGPTDALKRYVEEKVQRIGKYFDCPLEAHVILSVDGKQRQWAEIELQGGSVTVHGKDETQDLYAAIDLVIDKIERQVQKQKEKAKLERRRNAPG